MLKNYLFNPLCSAPFLYSSPLFLSASALHTSFFFFLFQPFLVSASPFFCFSFFFFSFLPAFLFFSVHVCLVFQPKAILSSAQNDFASAQNIFQFSPKPFFQFRTFLLQPKTFFFFSPKHFFLQPKTFFSSAQNLFTVQNIFASAPTCCSF